jgi:hypothetical protein
MAKQNEKNKGKHETKKKRRKAGEKEYLIICHFDTWHSYIFTFLPPSNEQRTHSPLLLTWRTTFPLQPGLTR